jgi:hemerythrin-like domain-containing protein
MPVTLGAKPAHGFDQPLGLLSDCHRRIERFLDILIQVTQTRAGGEPTEPEREALETALKYFEQAAPRHTRDEEDSLFPRLRQAAQAGNEQAKTVLAKVEALEHDHVTADAAHLEVNDLVRRWLQEGQLAAEQASHLAAKLGQLRDIYQRHLITEDQEVFPLAGQVLSNEQLQQVGQEMAARRGQTPAGH